MVDRRIVNPPALGRPVGYSHGIRVPAAASRGRGLLFIAGQVGARPDASGTLRVASKRFAPQFGQALDNVMEVLQAADGKPQDVVELTIYVRDLAAYRAARKELGPIWRRRMGPHYPAITLVEVSGLLERGALVEIRAVAALG